MTIDQDTLNSIAKAVDFIGSLQEPNGSFPTRTSVYPDNFDNATVCRSNFATSLISLSLSLINTEKSKVIRKGVSKYLLSEKSEHWTFNYWSRKSSHYKTMPYPDDLDDSSCALAALYKFDSSLIDGNVLARISQVLTALESKVGGPYKTWLVSAEADQGWQDIDIAVNANIAYFLSLLGVNLPKINKYIIQGIEAGQPTSPYYPTQYPIYYFISRFYKGNHRKKVVEKLIQLREERHITNPMDMALFVSTCLNFGYDYPEIATDIKYIISKQNDFGGWNAYAFYTGINPTKTKGVYYEGAESLTSAFCVEALDKYLQNIAKNKHRPKKALLDRKQLAIKKAIINEFNCEIAVFSDDFKMLANKILKQITTSEIGDQVLLLPYYFQLSLQENVRNRVTNDLIIKLGLANLFGWIAYTLFDDFYDDEGDKSLLPIANTCLRKLAKIYSSDLKNDTFSQFFDEYMNTLDDSNVWEILNCSLKREDFAFVIKKVDFGEKSIKIAEKSIGHILGPIYILNHLGIDTKSLSFQETKDFLTHYLVAKQMNDDAHDWEEDLKAGKSTCVLDILFTDFAQKTVGLEKIDELKEIFWNKTILKVCDLVQYHLVESTRALNRVAIIENKTIFLTMINNLEKIRIKTLKERQDTLDFIQSYK